MHVRIVARFSRNGREGTSRNVSVLTGRGRSGATRARQSEGRSRLRLSVGPAAGVAAVIVLKEPDVPLDHRRRRVLPVHRLREPSVSRKLPQALVSQIEQSGHPSSMDQGCHFHSPRSQPKSKFQNSKRARISGCCAAALQRAAARSLAGYGGTPPLAISNAVSLSVVRRWRPSSVCR